MRLVIITFVLLLLSNCNNKNNDYMFVKKIILNEKTEFIKHKAYYIIPPTICAGCNTHSMNNAIKILFEDYPAKVIFECFPENFEYLANKLKQEEVFDKKNFMIDTLLQYNNIDSLTLANSPIVIYLEKNDIRKVDFLDTKNPHAVNDLMNYLLNSEK